MKPVVRFALVSGPAPLISRRTAFLSALSVVVGALAAAMSWVLLQLISLFTNLAFYGRFSFDPISPVGHHLGYAVILIPVIGGLVVGFMARYGSLAIRGHGIPEAMEQVLFNQSRTPARVMFLKPLSGAVSIGTGGPFGAEGPIIASGAAMGSLVGQLLRTTADERKIILASGAAAGMAATFGSPLSAVLLAVELLLFEYRVRSLIPVSFASITATALRAVWMGSTPIFSMPAVSMPSGEAMLFYVALGLVIGLAAAIATRAVYLTEDWFNRIPVHWMWWPALGGLAVGVIGFYIPQTMGIGYDNISRVLSGSLFGESLLILCLFKFASWAIALGSGTSGGTLAPLFTIGGGLGGLVGSAFASVFPAAGVDPRLAALIGMAGIFAGASRAVLASVVFAFETTLQPYALFPLLGGCMAAYFVACALTHESIMTEKIARRGVHVPAGYSADFLSQVYVRDHASKDVVTLKSDDTVATALRWMKSGVPGSTHQGFPVVDENGNLLGMVTRRELEEHARVSDALGKVTAHQPVAVVHEDNTLREAMDLMVAKDIGRLPVLRRRHSRKIVGILSRSNILSAHRQRLHEMSDLEQTIHWQFMHWGRRDEDRRL